MRAVIDRATIPGRPREPKLAAQLDGVARQRIRTAHDELAVWRVGRGPAVLLVHGWLDSSRLWDPLMEACVTQRRSFVTFDLPGHGFSGGDRCLTAEVADAVHAVAAAAGPIDAAVAHSFATTGVTLATTEGVLVDHLVLVAPPLALPAADEDGADPGRYRWRGIANDLGLDPAVGEAALRAYLTDLGPTRSKFGVTEGLRDLDAAVLIVASPDDEKFDVGPARWVASECSHVHLVELEGLNHRSCARDANAVTATLGFLDRRSS
jgi:pimeloyl-ACP methyl ester carboxylesterase